MTDCQCIDIHKFTNPWLAFECLGYFLGLGHHDHPIQHCKKNISSDLKDHVPTGNGNKLWGSL